jgi:ubiquinone/menaquinone biosynthesis C-methylase UbiE
MIRTFIRQQPLLREVFRKAGRPRAEAVAHNIQRQLRQGDRVLDIGAGTCNLAELLQEREWQVTAMDVTNQSRVPGIEPIVYDGQTIPFPDDAFDVALLITVLHHTPDPAKVIREAKRVARRIIVVEDIYTSTPHKYATFFLDSLFNYEFIGHPHSNKDDAGWRALFNELKLKLTGTFSNPSFFVFKHGYYFLERM